jgi:hypothetical protein
MDQVSRGTGSGLGGQFLKEYSTESSVRRYTKETAGCGIAYLLSHDYGEIYLDTLHKCFSHSALQRGVRLWEFGCGGGMNLIYLVSVLERRGIPVNCAFGTDLSPMLIEAARLEVQRDLTPDQAEKVHFWVARNENLVEDVTKASGMAKDRLLDSFHLLLGVNTIRYCHRLRNEDQCVRGILNLLMDGGACVVIDMNSKFPAFRSRLRDRLTKESRACYLPSLDRHAWPFVSAGFRILRKDNFCWIPHSAGPRLTGLMKALAPALNALVRSRAMRSLIVAQKKAPRT